MKNSKTVVLVTKSDVPGWKTFSIGSIKLTLPVANKQVEREIVVRLISSYHGTNVSPLPKEQKE